MVFPRKKVVPGNSVAMTPDSAIFRIPSSRTAIRWSAVTALTSAASSAAPEGSNSSAWSRGTRPCFLPVSRIFLDCLVVKYPFSQKTSLYFAIPCSATAGIISLQMIFTYPSGSPANSGGQAWAPINVGIISISWARFTSSNTLSDLSSDPIFKPYPLLHSIVVVPKERNLSMRGFTRATRIDSDEFLTPSMLFTMPPPAAAISS